MFVQSSFGKLGNETLQSLLDDDEQLTTFLSNHIVAGVIPSVALMDGATVSSINGYNITVSVDGDVVMINEAMVVDKDMLANNGILHGIDAVLSTDNTSPSLSPSFSVSPSSSSNPAPAPVGSPVSDDSPSPDASSPTDPPVTESAPTSPVLPPVSGVDVASSRLSALGAVLGAVIAMLQLL